MRICIFIFFVLCTTCSLAQKKLASAAVANSIVYAGVDRPGDLYVIMTNGEAVKFDKNGKQIGQHKFKTVPTIFDPKDGTRAFAYFRDTQTTESIAPDLSFADATALHPEFAISAWLVCASKNELWILDSADVSLKKTKEKGMAIAYETPFEKVEIRNVTYMREYLNFLFVLDPSGIFIQNNLGKNIKKISSPKIPYFNFLGEEIYYLSGNSLQLVDLYTTDKREIALPHSAQFALITDDRMILVDGKTIEFFEFKP